MMKARGLKFSAAILLIIGLATSCKPARDSIDTRRSQPGNPELVQDLRNLHLDKYFESPRFEPQHTQVRGWDVYSFQTEELRCVTGGEYFIMARRGTEADRTVLWLEGGGACFPGRDDCTKEAQYYDWIEANGLASGQEENPVRGWNFIYVPYCDGSLHWGDNDADYDEDGVVDHWHWGLKTTSAAVRLMKALFPDSKKILIAGCSAGGAGTMGAAPVTRLHFPEAKLYVLNVSGSGLVPPEKNEAARAAKDAWNAWQFIPADCPRCNEQIIYMYAWLLERDSRLKVGLFSSYHDFITSSGWKTSKDNFAAQVIDTTKAIRAEHPDTFKRFFITGDRHCLDDYSYEVNRVSFWDWVGYLVNDDLRWIDILE